MRADDLRFRRGSFIPGISGGSSSLPDSVATGLGAVSPGVVDFLVSVDPGGRAYRGRGTVKSSSVVSISPPQYSHAELIVEHMVGDTSSIGALFIDVGPVVSSCGATNLVDKVGWGKLTVLPSPKTAVLLDSSTSGKLALVDEIVEDFSADIPSPTIVSPLIDVGRGFPLPSPSCPDEGQKLGLNGEVLLDTLTLPPVPSFVFGCSDAVGLGAGATKPATTNWKRKARGSTGKVTSVSTGKRKDVAIDLSRLAFAGVNQKKSKIKGKGDDNLALAEAVLQPRLPQ